MKKYKLELTRKQLSVIQEACEFMSRFSAGQLAHFPPSLDRYLHKKFGIDEFCRRRDKWESYLAMAKDQMFDLSEHASLSIGHRDLTEEAKICYDIYRPILETFDREQREKDKKEGNEVYHNVYSSPGLTYSKQGRIEIK